VLVVTDLASLRGPAQGTVTLPLWLYWSPAGRPFDLGKPFMVQSMYQTVLGEASRGAGNNRAVSTATASSFLNAPARMGQVTISERVEAGPSGRHRKRARVPGSYSGPWPGRRAMFSEAIPGVDFREAAFPEAPAG
jgi:hypothetical protein